MLLEDVLADLDVSGTPVALEGGITNQNFRVGDLVVRLPGVHTGVLGIDRVAERAATEAAAAAGVGPPVVAFVRGCLVTRFIEGTPMTAADVRARLDEVVVALQAVHAAGPIDWAFSPLGRVEAYALAVDGVPREYHVAHDLAVRVQDALRGPEHAPVLCHSDLLPANLLHDGAGVRIVDWEYAGMGDRYFDLANLSANNVFDAAAEEALIAAYFGEATPRRLAALRLQRLMANFWEAMWGVVQATYSALEFDFHAYAAEHFARLMRSIEAAPVDEWLRDAAG